MGSRLDSVTPEDKGDLINSKQTNYSMLDLPEVNKKLYISWGTYDTCKFTLEQTHKVKPLGLVNCLNYGHPKDSLNCLQKFVENLTERCKKDNIPVLGGNVSLYNATDGESIQPSPILVMIGLKDNDQWLIIYWFL